MDFLRHNLKSEEHTAQSGQDKNLFDKIGGKFLSQIQPSQVSPKPESLLVTSGDSLDYTSIPPPPPPTPMREDVNFIGKLSSVVGGDYCDVSVLVPPPTTKVEGLWEKFGNTLRHPSTPVSAPPAPLKEESNLPGKLTSIMGGDHGRAIAPAAASTQQGLLGKIGGVLSAEKPAPRLLKHESSLAKFKEALGVEKSAPEPPKPEGLFGKIGEALGVKKPVHGPPKGEGLLEKINDGIEGKHEELAKPRILVGKIDQALGGGAVLEKNEGVVRIFRYRI